jgi:hypothetical protein
VAIFKIQNGGHCHMMANVNISFGIALGKTFLKMYGFHTLHKIPVKIHSEPDYEQKAVSQSLRGSFSSLFEASSCDQFFPIIIIILDLYVFNLVCKVGIKLILICLALF